MPKQEVIISEVIEKDYNLGADFLIVPIWQFVTRLFTLVSFLLYLMICFSLRSHGDPGTAA